MNPYLRRCGPFGFGTGGNVSKDEAVILSLIICPAAGESVRTDLMLDPRSKSLVLNGKPGHLQFYSLQRDKLLYNVSPAPGIT